MMASGNTTFINTSNLKRLKGRIRKKRVKVRNMFNRWLCVCVCVCVCVSCYSHVQLFATLWTAAHQAPLSMRVSRHEYWNGLPCLAPEDLPDPGIEPMSPALTVKFFSTEPPGKPPYVNDPTKIISLE